MGDDQMILGIYGNLHVVGNRTRALRSSSHGPCIRVGSGQLPIRFTTSRLQVLGPLHHHVNPGLREESLLASASTFLLKSWRDRRRQQEMFGHDHLALPGAALSSSQNAFEGLDDERVEPNGVHTHQHGELERHHHAVGDASVLALDSAGMGADAMDGGTSSSLLFFRIW